MQIRYPASTVLTPARPSLRLGIRRIHVAVAGAILLAVAIRLALVLPWGFPIGDGGMFYTMTRQIQEAGYRLPVTTTYNHLDLPFAYSPLGFYVAAALSDLTGASVTTVFMWLPAIVSALAVLAFYPLAVAMLPRKQQAVLATFILAVLPPAFLWTNTGGGVTRSFGFLFVLLAMTQAHRLFVRREHRAAILGGVFVGLTALSHLESGGFASASFVIFAIAYARNRRAVVDLAIVAAVALLVSCPWWITIIARDGLDPFLNAGGTGLSDPFFWTRFLGVLLTGERYLPIFLVLFYLGIYAELRAHRWFLPVLPLLIVGLFPRAGLTFAAAPMAMLMAVGVLDIVIPFIRRRFSGRSDHRLAAASGVVSAAVVGWGVFMCALMPAASDGPVRALSAPNLEAMAWAKANTPHDASFVVMSGAFAWWSDATAEWFPTFADRQSVATAQGVEWLGHDAFTHAIDREAVLQLCTRQGPACMENILAADHLNPGYVYVGLDQYQPFGTQSYETAAGLRDDLAADPSQYRLVFENDGAAIFQRLSP